MLLKQGSANTPSQDQTHFWELIPSMVRIIRSLSSSSNLLLCDLDLRGEEEEDSCKDAESAAAAVAELALTSLSSGSDTGPSGRPGNSITSFSSPADP